MQQPSTAGAGQSAPLEDVEAWLQPIPESQRTHKVSGQFWIWAGANLAPINWYWAPSESTWGWASRTPLRCWCWAT